MDGCAGDLPNTWVVTDRGAEDCHVPRSAEMVGPVEPFVIQSVGVGKLAVPHAQVMCSAVHCVGKGRDRPAEGFGNRNRRVVSRRQHQPVHHFAKR